MTIIKLTKADNGADCYINVDNMTTMVWRENNAVTEMSFVSEYGVCLKETPKQIMAKIRRAVGRLIPGDPDDSLEK